MLSYKPLAWFTVAFLAAAFCAPASAQNSAGRGQRLRGQGPDYRTAAEALQPMDRSAAARRVRPRSRVLSIPLRGQICKPGFPRPCGGGPDRGRGQGLPWGLRRGASARGLPRAFRADTAIARRSCECQEARLGYAVAAAGQVIPGIECRANSGTLPSSRGPHWRQWRIQKSALLLRLWIALRGWSPSQ